MSGIAAVLALVLFATSVATGRGDDLYRGLSCTVKTNYGRIDTVCLRVPKAGGPCKLVSVSPAVISGPGPNAPGSGEIVTVSRSYMTNFAGSPAKPLPPSTVLPSPDTVAFAGMVLKDLGTLTTTPGVAYTDCRLITFQKDAVIVVWTGGVLKIILADLDAASRQRVEAARGK